LKENKKMSKEQINTAVVTLTISAESKGNFDAKFYELNSHAVANRKKEVKKGDLMSKIINSGVKQITPEKYFKE
jgi:hypothetical protein